MSSERRRSPRVQILGKLHGYLVALDVPVTVVEISLGGLGLETPIDFPVGVVHEFSLTLGDGSTVSLKGRVMHCRRTLSPDTPARYTVGVQFIDDDAAETATVTTLITRVS